MLTIYPPEIIERENETILQAKFECGDTHDVLWFSTTKEYGKYLCHERADAFLVALLLYAMKRGEDIHVIAPVSERLNYTLTKHFVKVLADTLPGYSPIKITGPVVSGPLENAGGVGTGLSCGIDSFCTIVEHVSESCAPGYKLTHLAFFNVGADGDFGGQPARDLFHRRIETIRPCADDLQLPLVTLDSNISEILRMDFVPTHTYRNIAAVLAFQKLFSTYYYSSSHNLWQFGLDPLHSSRMEVYSLDMLSTDTTKFYSSGEIYDRVEKTNIVAGFPLSYKYLNVCVAGEQNCSRCSKCERTLLTLDMLGKLDRYKDVFDLDYYRSHRSKYFGRMLANMKGDCYMKEIYDEIKKDGVKIPAGAYLQQYFLAIIPIGMKYCPEIIKRQFRKRDTT